MTTKADLSNALKEAMKAGDDRRKTTIRMAMAAIKQIEIDKGIEMDANGVIATLQKEVKSRRESIADADKAGRPELAEAARAEIAILESFLPQSLPAEELEALARAAIAEAGATSAREMGAVMKLLMPRVQGRATGDQISQTVKRLLG